MVCKPSERKAHQGAQRWNLGFSFGYDLDNRDLSSGSMVEDAIAVVALVAVAEVVVGGLAEDD